MAQALVESTLRHDRGARIELPADPSPFVSLFSESSGRVLVSVQSESRAEFLGLCATHGIPRTQLGWVTEERDLAVSGQFTLSLDRIREAWTTPIPAALIG